MERNQRAYRIADCVARSVSPGVSAHRRLRERVAARWDRAEISRSGRRVGCAVHDGEDVVADGVCADGGGPGSAAGIAPSAGAGTVDHRGFGYFAYARDLYKTEPRQDVCGGRCGHE